MSTTTRYPQQVILLDNCDLYQKTQQLAKAIITYYKPLLSIYEYQNLTIHCFKLNSTLAQAFTLNVEQQAYITQIHFAYNRYDELKRLLVKPSPLICSLIQEIDMIFIKIKKKKGGPSWYEHNSI